MKTQISALILCTLFYSNLLGQASEETTSPSTPVTYTLTTVSKTPQFIGGEPMLMAHIKNNTQLPEEARTSDIRRTVVVEFIIGVDGSVSDIKTRGEKFGLGLEEEAIRVVKLTSGKWQPAELKGEKVRCLNTVSITFKHQADQGTITRTTSTSTDTIVEIFEVTVPAKFKDGEAALSTFISKNIEYPVLAQESDISGRIMMQFVIRKDGSVTDVKYLGKAKGFGLEEEAIRVIKLTDGLWTPAMQRDKAVAMRFRIPINFTLYSDNTQSITLPTYGSSSTAFSQFLKDNMNYPSKAKKKGVEGDVRVSFVIDRKGKMKDVKVDGPANKALGKEALRLVKLSADGWKPATRDGVAIERKVALKIPFRL